MTCCIMSTRGITQTKMGMRVTATTPMKIKAPSS